MNGIDDNAPGGVNSRICITTYIPTCEKGIYLIDLMEPKNGGRYCE